MPTQTENPETLKFQHGKFLFAEVETPKIRAKLYGNPYWTNIGDDSYTTENLGAAAVYRRFSDDRTKRLFERMFQAHYDLPPLPKLPLDPHQHAGLRWVLSRKRSYLAHAPGAGKTCVAIMAGLFAAPEEEGRILFIVPPQLTVNWEREIMKFTEWVGYWPAIGRVGRSDKQNRVAWDADFVICPDSMLTKPWVYTQLVKRRWKVIAVDEASRFKDCLAERSLAFYGGRSGDTVYPGIYQDARHVVFLDGSPMPNRPMELWAPTYALHPEAVNCMDQNDFGYRYCGARPNARGQWEFLYSSNEKELREKLRKDFMHVVTEDELTHPERRRSMVFMDQDVRSAEHKTWERRHLGQITSFSEEMSQGDIARYRRELGIAKVPWIASYVRDRLKEKNESILLFAWHRDVCEQLEERLASFRPGLVYGGTHARFREKAFTEFQCGQMKLLIMNIAAGGRGHNLQRADRVIFGEWSWTDEVNKQCEHRTARRGNESEYIRCEYVVAPGSMDERVLSSVFTKQKRVERIIG